MQVFLFPAALARKKCATARTRGVSEKSIPSSAQSSGASIGIAKLAFTRSTMTIVLKPLMFGFS